MNSLGTTGTNTFRLKQFKKFSKSQNFASLDPLV